MRIFMTGAVLTAFFATPSIAADNTGEVVFNVDEYPVTMLNTLQPPSQLVTLLSCGPKKKNIQINWSESGQKFEEHYGWAGEDFTSKYYLASPPVFNKKKQAILGQLIPDSFTFHSPKPIQTVDVTYSVLPAVTSKEIMSDFTHTNSDYPHSCEHQGVNLVPINIQCKDFPRLSGKKGASGIGFLENHNTHFDSIFIANHPNDPSKPMHCTATILDDIILNYDVNFINGKKVIDMAGLKKMQFMCEKRKPAVIPSGCKNPAKLKASRF